MTKQSQIIEENRGVYASRWRQREFVALAAPSPGRHVCRGSQERQTRRPTSPVERRGRGSFQGSQEQSITVGHRQL